MRSRLKTPVTALLLASFSLWSTSSHGATINWTLDNNGNWADGVNWLGGTAPNAIGDVANFNAINYTSNRTITLNAAQTVGGLVLGDTLGAQTLTFAGTNTLTFDALAAGRAFINKYSSATDTWQAPLVLNDHLDANIFAGTFDVNGASNAQVVLTSAASDIVKNGAGTLRFNMNAAAFAGNWVLNQGGLTLGGAASATPTLGTGAGSIILNGTGSTGLSTLTIGNNGTAITSDITFGGTNDVIFQGAATINVNQNHVAGANTGKTIILDNLTMNGGILAVTGSNSYALRFNGTTTLNGQTNVFSPTSATLTLGGVITDVANTRALIKEGSGRLVITNSANTYDGVTAIKDGFLTISSGAKLGTGKVFVNGGVLTLSAANQTGVATIPGGLNLVSQIGTSRAILPVITNTGFTIDAASPINVTVPYYGMVMGVEGNISNNINLSQIGGTGNTRVSLANLTGADRTYSGTITAASNNVLRLHSAGNTFIISTANALGGTGSNAALVVGLPLANPLVFSGQNITQGNGGTVSIRANNNSATLGAVTVNRGVTLNINGNSVSSPIGTNIVTALGGTISTDSTTDAKFGNTDFRLYGGSTLLLDNSAVTATNTDRRLLNTTNLDLTSSTLRLIGDGGAATVSSQTVASIDYYGGSTISLDTDATAANSRLTTLTTGALNRFERGTLNIRNTQNTLSTLGTSAGTQKLILTANPTVTNGMIGANVVIWAGTNLNDPSDTRFATYNATHGVEAAAFGLTPTTAAALQAATATQIVDFNNIAGTTTLTGNATMQALRLRTTAATQVLNSSTFTITLGASAGANQGAGLQLLHTANDTVTHPVNIAFGSQEGLIFASGTAANTSTIIAVSGVISGTNGITRFGNSILRLSGANTFTGPFTNNSGETRLNNVSAAGTVTGVTREINLWGGAVYFEAGTQRYNNNVTFYNDARFGNVNVGNTGFNNLTVAARTGSSAPIVLDLRNQAGNNTTYAFGGLTLNGPAQAYVTNVFQINGAISGIGALEKFGNERLFIAGDSSSYSPPGDGLHRFPQQPQCRPYRQAFRHGSHHLSPRRHHFVWQRQPTSTLINSRPLQTWEASQPLA